MNDIKCSLVIKKLRLQLINEMQYKNHDEEKRELEEDIKTAEAILKNIDTDLKALQDRKLELYKRIVIDGMSKTKAVKSIADDYFCDESNIWRNDYKKIKDRLERIEGDLL